MRVITVSRKEFAGGFKGFGAHRRTRKNGGDNGGRRRASSERPGGYSLGFWCSGEAVEGGGGLYGGVGIDSSRLSQQILIRKSLGFGSLFVFVSYTMKRMMTSGARPSAREEKRWAACWAEAVRARGSEEIPAVGFGPVGLSPLFFLHKTIF